LSSEDSQTTILLLSAAEARVASNHECTRLSEAVVHFVGFQGFEFDRVRLWDSNFPDVCKADSALQLNDPSSVEFFEVSVLEVMSEYFFMTVPAISHHGRSNLAQPNPVTPSRADERESRRILRR